MLSPFPHTLVDPRRIFIELSLAFILILILILFLMQSMQPLVKVNSLLPLTLLLP